jgi:hypothetical protein
MADTSEENTLPSNQPTRAADVALDDTPASLDEAHPMNAQLRDNGVGLVPRVLEVNLDAKYAVLAASAIAATFHLPLGWHAIDDGRRTLIFDAEGRVQVNLDLRSCPVDHATLLTELLHQHIAEQPELEYIQLELDGMLCLGLRNYRVEGELLEQAFLTKDTGNPGMALVARVTAAPEDMMQAMNLAEVVLRNLQ